MHHYFGNKKNSINKRFSHLLQDHTNISYFEKKNIQNRQLWKSFIFCIYVAVRALDVPHLYTLYPTGLFD